MATKKPPKNGISSISSSQNLRAEAEARLKKSNEFLTANNLPIKTTNQLLHELQVHQIELEMQNEELRESQIALEIVRSRYFDLYDLAPIGYLTLNKHGLIQQANLTITSLLGITRSSLINQPLSRLILKEDQDVYYFNHKNLVESGKLQSFDLRIFKNDGTTFWANLVITLAHSHTDDNNDSLELRVVLSDISVRKQSEQDLYEARLIADRANLAKSEFLSRMSHELRTPLNAILGFAQLIESSDPLPIAQKRNIHQIIKAGWYLLEQLNEILDLAVIESGKIILNIETLSFSEVLNDANAMLELEAEKRGIDIIFQHPDEPYFIKADRVRAKQVFVNLISNAIKYNKSAGSVIVSYKKISNQRMRICIEDTGEGLTAENIEQLFQPFNRLGKEASEVEGTGIGLVVCKRIVELMGGAIGVESILGKGSVFWVELNLTDSF